MPHDPSSPESGTTAPQIEPHLLPGGGNRRIKLPSEIAAEEASPPPAEGEGGGGEPPAEVATGEGGESGETTPEPKPEETPAERAPPKPPEVDAAFRKLMQRSKKVRDAEERLRKRQQEEEATKQELAQLKERLSKRDYSLLTEHGGSLEDWSNKWLEEQGEKPSNPLERELQATKEQLQKLVEWQQQQDEQRKQAQLQADETAARARMQEFQQEINETIAGDPEFKMLELAGVQHDVYGVIQQQAAKSQREYGTPRILDTKEAAKYVKEYYAPRLKTMIRGLLELPDFKELLDEIRKPAAQGGGNGSDVPKPKAPRHDDEGHTASPAKTLTNAHATTAPPRQGGFANRKERLAASAGKLRFVRD